MSVAERIAQLPQSDDEDGSLDKEPKRGHGSKSLTILQAINCAAMFGGGIAMVVLSEQEASKDPPQGEAPLTWIVSGRVVYSKNLSHGYILGAGMIANALMLLYDIAMLFKGCRTTFLGKKLQEEFGETWNPYERRSHSGRNNRLRARMALTWWTLTMALMSATGAFDLIQQVSGILLTTGALMLLFSAQTTAVLAAENKGADKVVIPILTSVSLVFGVLPFLVMWINYNIAKDLTNSPVPTILLAPLILFSVNFFLYWALASAKAMSGISISKMKGIPMWLKPAVLFSKLFTYPAEYVMDAGFKEELLVTVMDMSNFAISSWIIFENVTTVHAFPVIPLS